MCWMCSSYSDLWACLEVLLFSFVTGMGILVGFGGETFLLRHTVECQGDLLRLNLVIRLDWNQMLNKAHGTLLSNMPVCSIRTGWFPQLCRQSVLFLQPFFNHSPIRLWWGEWLLQDWDVCLLLLAALTRIVAGNRSFSSPSLLSCLTVW